MQDAIREHRLRGRDIGLVPTMGALHDGHMSLVRNSMSENHHTVVSIFVNPAQFGQGEDLDNYPRDPDGDRIKLEAAGVDYIYAPTPEAMYPDGFTTNIKLGDLEGKLCGAFRPGHFSAVATVVSKLINSTLATRAYFGLKDYQQYLVIRRMVADLNMPVEAVGCATFRETDGLAMSSRNAYLDHRKERAAATVLYETLQEGQRMLQAGSSPDDVDLEMSNRITAEPQVTELQYVGVYNINTLGKLDEFSGKAVLAGAIKMGSTRLIDNILIE